MQANTLNHVQECALLSTWTTCNFPVRIKSNT
jgi:hypothetical protein